MKRIVYLLAALLCACGKPLCPPQPNLPDRYLGIEGFSERPLPHAIRWWECFADTTLNRLMEVAIANNRDLASAASRVEAARLRLAVARSEYLPEFDLGIEAEGDYTDPTGITQKYTVEPTLSWEISLFGALRNADRAARAAILSSEWAFRGVMLSLTGEVATTYYTLRQYEENLRIARRSYTLRRTSAALIDSLFRYGMSTDVALQQARSLVFTAEADIPQYERSCEQTRRALDVLLGVNPGTVAIPSDTTLLAQARLPETVPVGLPTDLLHRRPDVMESYYAVREAAAQAGIARAARFPSLSITAAGGLFSTSLKELTSGNPWAWNAVGSITQPLFAFGKLRRNEQIARENYYNTVFAYEQRILQALSDVEQALVGISTMHNEIERYRQLVEANERIAYLSQALYANGMSAYLEVIDAERELYESQMELTDLRAQQYIDYIDLFKALGGGW